MVSTGKKEGLFKRAGRFLKECWMELQKASWPNAEDLKKSTLVVLAAVAIVTIWIGGLDSLFGIVTGRFVGW